MTPLCRASPAIWDHIALAVTESWWMHPASTPARQAGTRSTYPGGMKGWVDLGIGYIPTLPRWSTCPMTVTNLSSNQWIVTQPGIKPIIPKLQVQHPNVTLPSLYYWMSEWVTDLMRCASNVHQTLLWANTKLHNIAENTPIKTNTEHKLNYTTLHSI